MPILGDDACKPQATRAVDTSRDTCNLSQAKLQELIRVLPAAVYVTDMDGNLTYYNTAAVELWGCGPELGTSAFRDSWKLYWSDGRPVRGDEWPTAVALRTREQVRGGEVAGERPDGTRIPLISYAMPLHDADGRLNGAVNMLVDITERKMLEQVAAHAHRLEILNGVAKVISIDLDLDRIAQTVTELAVEGSGARLGAFLRHAQDERGLHCLVQTVSHEGTLNDIDIASGGAVFDATMRDGITVRSDDIRNDPRFPGNALRCRIDGKRQEVASYLAAPVARHGKLHGALILCHPGAGVFGVEAEDFLKGIAAHAAVAIDNAHVFESGRQLAAIVETTNDAIVSKDTRGIVRFWNPAAERLFGYTAEEMIGKSILSLIPTERYSEEERILELIRRGERIDTYETVRVRKDGTLVDVSLSVSPLKDAKGKIVGASKIARDITERKQALARQELLAREINHRTKNLFALVNSVVARSFANKETVEDAKAAVLQRLRSLAQTHVMLLDGGWQGADLRDVVRAEMCPYEERVAIDGPSLTLSTQAAQNFALALHELATNAAKHGALSVSTGQVLITWRLFQSDGQQKLVFNWEERGGPPVSVPGQRGFGSTVLEDVMAEYFDAPPRVDFAPTGVKYELIGSLDAISG